LLLPILDLHQNGPNSSEAVWKSILSQISKKNSQVPMHFHLVEVHEGSQQVHMKEIVVPDALQQGSDLTLGLI
jgi:hypothetical protein